MIIYIIIKILEINYRKINNISNEGKIIKRSKSNKKNKIINEVKCSVNVNYDLIVDGLIQTNIMYQIMNGSIDENILKKFYDCYF